MGRFSRDQRLTDTQSFAQAFKKGRRKRSRAFELIWACRPGPPRLGVIASRRVGGAVVRNRVRRCVREWYRLGQEGMGRGDLIVRVFPGASEVPNQALREDLTRLLKSVMRTP